MPNQESPLCWRLSPTAQSACVPTGEALQVIHFSELLDTERATSSNQRTGMAMGVLIASPASTTPRRSLKWPQRAKPSTGNLTDLAEEIVLTGGDHPRQLPDGGLAGGGASPGDCRASEQRFVCGTGHQSATAHLACCSTKCRDTCILWWELRS